MEAGTARKLKQDLHAVVVDTEELLKATANQTGEHIDKVRARVEKSLRSAASEIDNEAHRYPWVTACIAGAAGMLLGLLIGRR